MKTTTISSAKLKFYGRSRDLFPEIPSRGIVGSHNMPRIGSYNLFVVINYEKDIECLHVIYPRMRIIDNEVKLGVDKMKEFSRKDFYEVSSEYKYGIYYIIKNYYLEWEKKDSISIYREQLDDNMLQNYNGGYPIIPCNNLEDIIISINMKELDEIYKTINDLEKKVKKIRNRTIIKYKYKHKNSIFYYHDVAMIPSVYINNSLGITNDAIKEFKTSITGLKVGDTLWIIYNTTFKEIISIHKNNIDAKNRVIYAVIIQEDTRDLIKLVK